MLDHPVVRVKNVDAKRQEWCWETFAVMYNMSHISLMTHRIEKGRGECNSNTVNKWKEHDKYCKKRQFIESVLLIQQVLK